MPLNPADDCFLSALEGALPQGRLRAPKPHELAEPRGRGASRAWSSNCRSHCLPTHRARSVGDIEGLQQRLGWACAHWWGYGACNGAGLAVRPFAFDAVA